MTRLAEAAQRLKSVAGQPTRLDLGTVRARDFHRFAHAAGRTVGDPAVAHPLYLSAVMGWGDGPDESELREDGTETTVTADLPLDGLRLMGAGQDLVLHHPVVDGQNITMEVNVDDVVLKEGRSGELIVLTLRRIYVTDDGTHLATCLETIIAR